VGGWYAWASARDARPGEVRRGAVPAREPAA
jgi:hypothetical protein